ncbi:MAG: hypothetical protein KBG83_07080, partial [Bacteroidetes bacterium]|nr:hypothetical protein [Bacteroidota bacterium]
MYRFIFYAVLSLGSLLIPDGFLPAQTIQSDSLKVSTQRSNRHARAAEERTSLLREYGATKERKPLYQIDSTALAQRDSSARIEQFIYVRKDKPVVDGEYHKTYPLFLSDPPIVRYRDDLDTARWVYRLRCVVNDGDVKIPIDVPLEEYTELRLRQTIRKNWEELVQPSLSEEKKVGLAEVMGKITNIEIPVPKNPIFSIFGPNIIRLQINGGVDIHAAFRNTKSDLFTASPLGQSQNEPDFGQEVQVTVKGEIGDKLQINADWNTQRTFEYENQLHVQYKG